MTDTTASTVLLPIGIRTLPDGSGACADCGQVTPADLRPNTYPVYGRIESTPAGLRTSDLREGSSVTMPLCDTCHTRRDHAADLLDAHPGIRARIGSRSIGVHRVACALLGIAALGQPIPDTLDAYTLDALLDRLTDPGASARWSSRFSPVMDAGASIRTAAAPDWLWMESDATTALHAAYRLWLGDKMPPRPTRHPDGGGCAWCGIGSVPARPSERPWTPIDVTRGSLGKFTGWTCPECTGYIDMYGTTMRAFEAALYDVADPGRELRRHHPDAPLLTNIAPFAVTGRKATTTRFGWVNLDTIRDLLR